MHMITGVRVRGCHPSAGNTEKAGRSSRKCRTASVWLPLCTDAHLAVVSDASPTCPLNSACEWPGTYCCSRATCTPCRSADREPASRPRGPTRRPRTRPRSAKSLESPRWDVRSARGRMKARSLHPERKVSSSHTAPRHFLSISRPFSLSRGRRRSPSRVGWAPWSSTPVWGDPSGWRCRHRPSEQI